MSIASDIVSDIVSDPVIDIVGGYNFIARGSGSELPLTSGSSHAGAAMYFFAVLTTTEAAFVCASPPNSIPPYLGAINNSSGSTVFENGFGTAAYYKNGSLITPANRIDFHALIATGSKVLLVASSSAWPTGSINAFHGSATWDFSSGTVHDTGCILQSDVSDFTAFQAYLMAENGL